MADSIDGGLIWEGAAGREGPAAALPGAGLAPAAQACGAIAQGMIDAASAQRADPLTRDGEGPLSAFLRAVDTTMWSIDAELSFSGAALAGLLGRPVAVASATLRLDIPQDLAATGLYDAAEAAALRDHLVAAGVFDAIKSRAFELRLGDASRIQDGLYGYFINEDYSRFHLIDKSIAGTAPRGGRGNGFRSLLGTRGAGFVPPPDPLDCPYIEASKPLRINAGQQVRLTLLMHPMARVSATCGLLPRKSLELLRDWVAPGLERIAPSARIGPVLIDPDKVRLPRIAAFGAEQSWLRRSSAITWRNDPILAATQAALLPDGPVSVEEGYIRITPDSEGE
jgi:hypothetical protein